MGWGGGGGWGKNVFKHVTCKYSEICLCVCFKVYNLFSYLDHWMVILVTLAQIYVFMNKLFCPSDKAVTFAVS